jgi:hypothetical protein
MTGQSTPSSARSGPAAATAGPASEDRANAYEVAQGRGRRLVTNAIATVGLVVCAVGRFVAEPPTLWGVVPIAMYAVLCLLGMDLMIATVVSLVGGVLIARRATAGCCVRTGPDGRTRAASARSRACSGRTCGTVTCRWPRPCTR